MLQYLAPILQLGCGVLIFHEPMPPARLAGFALVWLALIVFTADAVRTSRRTRQPAAPHPHPRSIMSSRSRPASVGDLPRHDPLIDADGQDVQDRRRAVGVAG